MGIGLRLRLMLDTVPIAFYVEAERGDI